MEAMEKFRPQDPGQNELRRKQAAENALFRVDVRRSLRLYRHVAIYAAVAVFCLLLAGIALSKKRYSSQSVVSVAPGAQHVIQEGIAPAWGADSLTFDTLIEQQIQLARRYDVLAKAIAMPGVTWRKPKESEQAAVDRLAKNVDVTRVGKSYQLSISVTATSAAQAALLANDIAQSFLDVSHQGSSKNTENELTALRLERTQLQSTLDDKIAQQSALLQKVHIVPGSTAPADNDFASLAAAAAAVKVKHDEAASQVRALSLPGAESAMSNETTTFPMANSLQEKRNVLLGQMAGLTPNHPLYKSDQIQLQDIDQQIAEGNAKTRSAALAREQSKARTELATETATLASLTGQLSAEASKVSKNTPEIEQSNALATEIARLEVRYGTVDDRIRNLELDNNGTNQLEITSTAHAPLQPNPNKQMLFLMLLLPAPILAGIFAAVVALRLDPRVYSASDVESVTGYPPFAMVLHRKEASPEVMEEYLLRMAAGVESLHTTRGVRTVLVTGIASETGASSIATALARKLQEVNRDSAVLDADADEAAVTQDDIRALADKHGLLLVDGPPILSSARSEYLARFTDTVLLIAESGRTTKDELRRAIRLLEKVNAGGVAVVLNKVTLASAEDAVQTEVAELEQRILERGTAGYTRPALRLYNTQVQERFIHAPAESAPVEVVPAEFVSAEISTPVISTPVIPTAAVPTAEVQTVEVAAKEVAPAQVADDAVDQLQPLAVSDFGQIEAITPEPIFEPAIQVAAMEASVEAPADAVVAKAPAATPYAAQAFQSYTPAPVAVVAPAPPVTSPEDEVWLPLAQSTSGWGNVAPAHEAVAESPTVEFPVPPTSSVVPEEYRLRESNSEPKPEPVFAFSPPPPPPPATPAFARMVLASNDGLFAAKKEQVAPAAELASKFTELPQPEPVRAAEPQESAWKYPTTVARKDAHADAFVAQHASEATRATPSVLSEGDPTPPRPAAAAGQTRRVFHLPWMSKSDPAKDSSGPEPEAFAATDDKDTETTIIEPSMPSLEKPSAYETYTPVPSKGWFQGRGQNGQKDKEKRRTVAPSWMDRAEIERQILGNGRRKD